MFNSKAKQYSKKVSNSVHSNPTPIPPKGKSQKESRLNHQKRDKLKSLIIQKFIQNFKSITDNIPNSDTIITNEVNAFFLHDKLTDTDLSKLESSLKSKL